MNNFFTEIENLLRTEERYFSQDGDFLRNTVYEDAMKAEPALIKLLLSNENAKSRFFRMVDGIAVFDKIEFGWVINNRQFLPDSYTRYKNKIGLVDSDQNYISVLDDVSLAFPYKDCLLEFDATDPSESRTEVFFNRRLAVDEIDRMLLPKVFSNTYRFDKTGKKKTSVFHANDNLIIKGNNLFALCSLLKTHRRRIKCMYWDILYNTANDKVPYNDSFKHSSWLLMMKNRLEVARELLTDDGVILIECDKHEDAYLKVLCDELFGRDNFVNSVTLQSSTPSGIKLTHRKKTILKTKDTLLIYKKGGEIEIEPQYIPTDHLTNFNYWLESEGDHYTIKNLKNVLIEQGIIDKKSSLDSYKMSSDPAFEQFIIENASRIFRKQPSMPEQMKKLCKANKNSIVEFTDDDGSKMLGMDGYRFAFLSASIRNINGKQKVTQLLCDIWTDISFHGTQYEGAVDLPAGKKPERLIKRIIEMFMKPGDIRIFRFRHFGRCST